MSDAIYRVVIDYELRGDIDRPAHRAGGKLGDLGRQSHSARHALEALGGKLASFGGAISDAFTGAVERVAELGLAAAKVGAVVGLGTLAYGAVHLNNELEQTQISLAAIFGAQGVSRNFNEGLSIASDTVAKIRADAAKLPVEADHLLSTFRMIATPAFMSGATVDQTRGLAAKTSLAGSFLAMPQDHVAREMTQLLEGRAGVQNTLGLKLAGLGGDKAQRFNQMSAPQRFAELERILDKFTPAMEAMGNSFTGRWTHFLSTGKTVLRIATEPVFERVKATLGLLNKGYATNEEAIERFARHLGGKLGEAYDVGERAIRRWGPSVRSFAEEASERIGSIWRRTLPIVSKIGEEIRQFVGSGHALDRLEGVLKLYIAVKGARALGGMAVGGIETAGHLATLAAFMTGRGAASAGLAAAGANAAGGAGAGLFGGGGLLGAAVAAPEISIPLAVVALESLALAAVGVGGAIHNLSDETSAYHAKAVEDWRAIREHGTSTLSNLAETFEELTPVVMPFVEWMGNEVAGALRTLSAVAEGATAALLGLAKAVHWIAEAAGFAKEAPHERRRMDADHRRLIAGRAENRFERPPNAGAGGGGGGTHIQKVEIVVSTNQEPSRIARRVVDLLADIGRNPTASRHAPNFSRARS